MVRSKGRGKPPSRKKYEEENPTVSCRLKKEEKRRLAGHLKGAGCSLRYFVLDALGREESMVNERVEKAAAKKLGPSDEERLRWHDGLLWQVLCTLLENSLPALCPRCEYDGEYRLHLAWGDEIGTDGKRQEAPTWKCPKCGWFVDTFGRKDPESIWWSNPGEVKLALKPKSPPKKATRGTRRHRGK